MDQDETCNIFTRKTHSFEEEDVDSNISYDSSKAFKNSYKCSYHDFSKALKRTYKYSYLDNRTYSNFSIFPFH